MICAQLNINSLRNKFESLINIINNNIDILMISETKLDPSFPTGQFHIHGFSEPYRFDRNSSGGGILLYIREDIPSKLILTKMTIEGFFVEINLRKKRWLLCCSYNPKKPLISEHLNEIGKNLDLLLSKYDKYVAVNQWQVSLGCEELSKFSLMPSIPVKCCSRCEQIVLTKTRTQKLCSFLWEV